MLLEKVITIWIQTHISVEEGIAPSPDFPVTFSKSSQES